MENGWKMEDGKCTTAWATASGAFKWYPFSQRTPFVGSLNSDARPYLKQLLHRDSSKYFCACECPGTEFEEPASSDKC
jgi:hypothetical protein